MALDVQSNFDSFWEGYLVAIQQVQACLDAIVHEHGNERDVTVRDIVHGCQNVIISLNQTPFENGWVAPANRRGGQALH